MGLIVEFEEALTPALLSVALRHAPFSVRLKKYLISGRPLHYDWWIAASTIQEASCNAAAIRRNVFYFENGSSIEVEEQEYLHAGFTQKTVTFRTKYHVV